MNQMKWSDLGFFAGFDVKGDTKQRCNTVEDGAQLSLVKHVSALSPPPDLHVILLN